MSVLQSLGHALLIAFGKTLVEAKLDPLLISALARPPFCLLLSLVTRLTQNHPDVYWEIQAANPYAKQYRSSFIESLTQLGESFTNDGRLYS